MNLLHRAIHSDRFWKRPALIGLAIVAVILLAGCATTFTPGEEAEARANAEPIKQLEPLIRRVDDVVPACRGIGWRTTTPGIILQGCSDAFGRIIPGRCLIIVPKDDPGWILSHELLHCKYGRWHKQ